MTLRLNNTFGLALEDTQTMYFYEFKDGQTILWWLDDFQIDVKYGKQKFFVNAKTTDTVETLKRRIENIEQFGNIPHEKQILKIPYGRVLEDNKSLKQCYVKEGKNVTVSWKEFEISVKYDEEEEPMNVEVEYNELVKD
ncbi:hypothetical protein niasHS_018079 [Heterodera schachtii]|uniref:Ubiquitin-like domain-containing protein n=1 Tax=Heterodera schachtii TaxID=97005 RepID=A0ABD2HQA4_HETSC